MKKVDFDIVLPCYNPQKGWVEQIITAYASIKQQLNEIQIGLYIVNDGSTSQHVDADIEVIRQQIPSLVYLPYQPNQGKGNALRVGVAKTTAPFVIYTDIDFPYLETSLLDVYRQLVAGTHDVVIGVRPMSYYDKVPPARRAISKVLRFFIKLFMRIPTTDTQAGIKGFNEKGKAVFLQTTIKRYLFDMEFIYLSARQKLKIYCQPVHLREGVIFSHMNWRVLATEGLNFLRILFLR
jgi:glycosyltransferase involved in cell wall biosynthesis